MYSNPADEWRALTGHYRSMVDEELIELAEDFNNLTPAAQQVLRDEMRLRKLEDPQAPGVGAGSTGGFTARRFPPPVPQPGSVNFASGSAPLAFGARQPELVSNAQELPAASGPVEYTWKTPLCKCDSDEQAWQISEMLRRVGIDSWIEGPGTYANSSGSQEGSFDTGSRRVMVAADQLEEARNIAEQPVPADIVEQSKSSPPEYEAPICPECGAADPLLEDVDPVNAWKCEACGAEWSDVEPETSPGMEDAPTRG
jgi:hypothetical protein